MTKEKNYVDVVMLTHLASTLEKDVADGFGGIDATSMLNIADRIRTSIGAPVMTDTRNRGADAAGDLFPGNPSARAGFNAGVAWVIAQWPELPHLYAQVSPEAPAATRRDERIRLVKAIEQRTHEYAEEYELRDDATCYTPTAEERVLLHDFGAGLINEFLEALDARREGSD